MNTTATKCRICEINESRPDHVGRGSEDHVDLCCDCFDCKLGMPFHQHPLFLLNGHANAKLVYALDDERKKQAEETRKHRYKMAVANLRHLYRILYNGHFKDHKELADGLLAPQIEFLESLSK